MTTTKKRSERRAFTYYNFDKLHSFNSTINMVVGARGIGKTYGKTYGAIKKGVETGRQFIYLRRYKTELKKAKATFFSSMASRFPEHDFRIMGDEAQYAPKSSSSDKKRTWFTIGHFISLNTAQTQKSVDFGMVDTIIYDEFIIEAGALHYIEDEVTVLLNFYYTVDRGQDRVRLYMLANSVSIDNPYFIAWSIEPKPNVEWQHIGKGFVTVHFPNSDQFANEMFQTKFGQFIQDTEYADYAVGNVFADNNELHIGKKDSKALPLFIIRTKKKTFSVWHSVPLQRYFIQTALPGDTVIYTMDAKIRKEGDILVERRFKPFQVLRANWQAGMVLFDKPATRVAFMHIFE